MSIDGPQSKNNGATPPQSKAPSGRTDTSTSLEHSKQPATSLDSINVKVGQAVRAKVLETLHAVNTKSSQQQANVTLEINGKTVAVKTDISLKPGQIISLNVNNKGELTLPKPTSSSTSPLISALSKVLPYQQPVAKVIATLLQQLPIIAANNKSLAPLVEQLTALLPKTSNFSANVSDPSSLTPSQFVKQAITQSGIFMESSFAQAAKQSPSTHSLNPTVQNSSLLNSASQAINQAIKSATTSSLKSTSPMASTALLTSATTETPTDLKSTLSQLMGTLNNLYATQHSATGLPPRFLAESDPALLINPFNFPSALGASKSPPPSDKDLSVGDLLKRLAGALNRIQFQQLNSLYQAQSLSSDATTVQSWQMELPFLTPQNQIDSVQLRIDEEKDNQENSEEGSKKSKWTLSLTFDLESLGPIFIQVNLSPPTVSSTIWAEKQQTLKLINKEAHNLRHSFSELGLTVEDITCRQGQPNMRKTRLDQQIVDIKA